MREYLRFATEHPPEFAYVKNHGFKYLFQWMQVRLLGGGAACVFGLTGCAQVPLCNAVFSICTQRVDSVNFVVAGAAWLCALAFVPCFCVCSKTRTLGT
jgi:hypothetical protein